MSNQSKRRRSERLAAYDEADGDFQFARGSKRAKTSQPEPIVEDEPATTSAPAPKKGRTKQAKQAEETTEQTVPAQKISKQRSKQVAVLPDDTPPPAHRTSRKRPHPESESAEKENEPVKLKAEKPSRKGKEARREPSESETAAASQLTPTATDKGESKKIALPFSDTPVMNRNKEMRRKTGGGRRSSLGLRGRRASSLIESGNSAIPHREVNPADFYQHIEAEGGLSEPRRMRQLLTWCGERALSEKPPLGSSNSNAILGARAIQDQLLKDFANKSEFSDWFSREDIPRAPAVMKPNPRNIEHEAKIQELESRIKRLKEEKKTWLALKQPPAELPPLFPPPESGVKRPARTTPNKSLLDPEEAEMLAALTDPAQSYSTLQAGARSRLQKLQTSLEFTVDHLADNIHKVVQRVATATREADRVLNLSAGRLQEREQREKTTAGTRDMPVMEVLRSLGRILPESDG